MRPFLQTFHTPSAVAKFRGLKSIAVVFCIGACSLTHAAIIEFSGPLVAILEDDDGAIYSGAQIGTVFSGVIDDVTFDGIISDGATLTPFTERGGGMWTENDQIMDADEAILVNSLAGTSFVTGDLYDEIEMGGDASTSGGGRIEISLVFLLDPLAFDNNPVDYYPPNPDDILLVVFGIEEINDQEEVIYLALGAVGGPLEILVDIKPGKEPNAINPTSGQKIPVAILTTGNFDAQLVDPSTVQFGPGAATESHRRWHVKDVDEDGDLDLLFHFNTQETGIACGDREATLTGETYDGQVITGSDSIKTVKCPFVDSATITVLIGDKDCFGLGGVCSDVALFVIGQEGNRDPGDPLGTDQSGVNFELGGPSFDFGLDLGGATPLSASLTILTAGIGFEGTTGGSGIGATFYFNGTEIGYYFEAPGFQNRAATIVFDVPIFLLADLNNITVFHPDIGNEVAVIRKKFAIDYLELTVVTATASP